MNKQSDEQQTKYLYTTVNNITKEQAKLITIGVHEIVGTTAIFEESSNGYSFYEGDDRGVCIPLRYVTTSFINGAVFILKNKKEINK